MDALITLVLFSTAIWRVISMKSLPLYKRRLFMKLNSCLDKEINHTQNQSDSNNGLFERLPDEVVLTILSKLDIVSLCRLSVASKQFCRLLPEITSLSTHLPSSIFLLKGCLRLWCTKLVRKVYQKLWVRVASGNLPQNRLKFYLHSKLFTWCVKYMWQSWKLQTSPSANRFFRILKGLEYLDLELPRSLTTSHLTRPNCWLRWRWKDFNGQYKYGVTVGATIIQDDQNSYQTTSPLYESDNDLLLAAAQEFEEFFSFVRLHECTGPKSLLPEDSSLRKIVLLSKDDTNGNNFFGKMHMCPLQSMQVINKKGNRGLFILCYTPSILELNCDDDHSTRLKDAWLGFYYHGELDDDEFDSNYIYFDSRFDLIMACLDNDVNNGRKDRELREAVLQILSDDKMLICYDFLN